MTRPDLLDDDPVTERLLRQSLAADADAAPRPDLHDLAGSAVRLGQSRRRRTAVAGTVVSVIVVLGGVAVASGISGPRQTEPPASGISTSPAPTPTATAEPGGSVLMFRGVEVPVPAAMLDPDAVRCGTPLRDAAYVVDDGLPVETCVGGAPQEHLTTVVMQPLEDVPHQSREAGGRRLPDGRWEVTSAIAERDVWLTVTSPDKARAERLFGSATIVAAPEGCAIHPGQVPLGGVGSPVLTAAVQDATTGRVCGYRAGWLTGATMLTPNQVADVVALIDSAPSDATIDCGLGNPGDDGWWVSLGAQRAWVETSSCPRIMAEDGDGSARLTIDLMAALWQLAHGPAAASGLVESKG